MAFEQTFKNIDDVLWKEAGCGTELDYTEQTSWLLFLKYLDDLEQERAMADGLVGKPYDYLLDDAHRWSRWAVPKTGDGTVDHNTAVTGDDLIAFVNTDLFPYLKRFTARASRPDTIEYKIGAIFSELQNKFRSGYSLREALELVDGLHFLSQEEKHELSHLYEAKIRNMGNAGRNGGEYYTPRPRKVRLMGRGPVSAGRVSQVISGHAACATVPRSHVRWLGEPPSRRSDRVSPGGESGPPGAPGPSAASPDRCPTPSTRRARPATRPARLDAGRRHRHA